MKGTFRGQAEVREAKEAGGYMSVATASTAEAWRQSEPHAEVR